MSKSLKKIVEESREKNQPEVDMCDRGISSMLDVPGLCRYRRRRAGTVRKLPYLSRASGGRPWAWGVRATPARPGLCTGPAAVVGPPEALWAWGGLRGGSVG